MWTFPTHQHFSDLSSESKALNVSLNKIFEFNLKSINYLLILGYLVLKSLAFLLRVHFDHFFEVFPALYIATI